MSGDTDFFLAAHFDAEMALLEAGVKTVIKMEFADEQRLSVARTLGFDCRTADGRYRVSETSADLDYESGDAQTVFVGREKDVRRALEVEKTERHTTGESRLEAMREMGILLGYPPCCTAAYATQDDQAETASFGRLLGTDQETTGTFGNNLFLLEHQLISHFPCTLGCPASEQVATTALEICKKKRPQHAEALEQLLRAPIRVWDRFRFLIEHAQGHLTARHISTIGRALAHPGYLAFDRDLPSLPAGGTRIVWT